jgi:putative N6-adenine-specific DNA methylase
MAYDHDPAAIRQSRRCATDAGVGGSIRFNCQEVSELRTPLEYGCIITNPPYGERLGDNAEVEAVYRVMGQSFASLETWGIYVLTSYRGFENQFGRKAPRRRKLYNGRLECQYYQYPGPRPPFAEAGAEHRDASDQPLAAIPEVALSPETPPSPFGTFVADCSTAADAITVDLNRFDGLTERRGNVE